MRQQPNTPYINLDPIEDRLFIGLLIAGLIIFALTVGCITALVWSFVANSFK